MPGTGKEEYTRRINLALRFVEDHYGEDVGLKEIADAAFFSPYHFHRIFKAIRGEGPVDYLRRIRLEKAAVLLAIRPEETITHIALETGFSSSAVFARAFVERFGVSAGAYRKSHGSFQRKAVSTTKARVIRGHGEAGGKHPDARYGFLRMRRMPALRLACVHSMAGYGPPIEAAWRKLLAWAYPRGIVNPDSRLYGIPLDDPEVTSGGKCRYFAAISIPSTIVPDGAIELFLVKPSCYAEFSYEGKLKGFQSFYNWVYGEWLPESGYLPADRPTLEEYAPEPPDASSNRIFRFSFLLSVRSE